MDFLSKNSSVMVSAALVLGGIYLYHSGNLDWLVGTKPKVVKA